MLCSLVVGMGRAGLGLHCPVLRRARKLPRSRHLFAAQPILGYDPLHPARADKGELRLVGSLTEAARAGEPESTVVHLCTPPAARAELLEKLAAARFRRILIEKPIARDRDDLEQVLRVRDRYDLDLLGVGQWRASELTKRVRGLLRHGHLGTLRSITFVQNKPRFSRTLAGDSHHSAFDVEVPHAVDLALLLAGPARVTGAAWGTMSVGSLTAPRLGRARLRLSHDSGVHTDIRSDLTAPVRERRVTLELTDGRIVGHFPVSDADQHAQLTVHTGTGETHAVLPDDSLLGFFTRVYRHFTGIDRMDTGFADAAEVVRLLDTARTLCEPHAAPAGACPAR